jgi:hypothetical protein
MNSVLSGNKMSIQTGRTRPVLQALKVSQSANKKAWTGCKKISELELACKKLDFHDRALTIAYSPGHPGRVHSPPMASSLPCVCPILSRPVHTQADKVSPNKPVWCLCRLHLTRSGDSRPFFQTANHRMTGSTPMPATQSSMALSS